jgi:hypothetical protein
MEDGEFVFTSYNRRRGALHSNVVSTRLDSEKLIEDGSSILDEWHRRDPVIYQVLEDTNCRMLHAIACCNSYSV